MADVLGRAPGHRWGRFLHDRSLDLAGLVTYYSVFMIDLSSRRVPILGSPPHPEALFMQQIVRTLTMAEPGVMLTAGVDL